MYTVSWKMEQKLIPLMTDFLLTGDRFAGFFRLYCKSFFMAKNKTSPKDKENGILDYTEHMPLLRKIIWNFLQRDGVKERQRNTYE